MLVWNVGMQQCACRGQKVAYWLFVCTSTVYSSVHTRVCSVTWSFSWCHHRCLPAEVIRGCRFNIWDRWYKPVWCESHINQTAASTVSSKMLSSAWILWWSSNEALICSDKVCSTLLKDSFNGRAPSEHFSLSCFRSLKPRLDCYQTDDVSKGAGLCFNEGMKGADVIGCDWCWCFYLSAGKKSYVVD